MNDTIKQVLGRVKVTPKGGWDATTQYLQLDIVTYSNGNVYICTKNCIGISPTNNKYWQLLMCGSAHQPYLDSNGILRWDLNGI